MDKIKNILHPGKSQDDELLYGSGQTPATSTKTGGLSGEGSHFGNARDTTSGATAVPHHGRDEIIRGGPFGTSSEATGPKSSGIANTSGPTTEHHLGKDAAVGGGAAGLAGHEYQKHETTSGSDGSNTNSGLGNNQNTGYASRTTTAGPHSSNLANKADPRIDSDLDNSRTVGSGVAGSNSGYTGTQGSSYHSGPSGTAVGGPHNTDTANRLDPSVNTQGTSSLEDDHHSKTHGGGAEEADRHHLGRDAAIGAGGVGLTEHEHHKHQNERTAGLDNTAGQSTTGHAVTSTGHQQQGVAGGAAAYSGPAPNTAGPHKSDLLNKLDPRVGATPDPIPGRWPANTDTVATTGQSTLPHHGNLTDHHTGRDAALAGTAGGAAYEAGKHRDHNTQSLGEPGHSAISGIPESTRPAPHASNEANQVDSRAPGTTTGTTTTTTTTTCPHSSNIANKADPRVDSDNSKDRHYGRDVALVGGTGAAAYGAHEHSQRHEPTTSTTAGTTAGTHSSNIANRADPTIDSDRSKDLHYGRDAALVGGAGAAGYGAHEYSQKHGHDGTPSTATTTAGPHSSDLANKADPTVDSDRSKEKDHHYGRDAAIAGGVGGASYAADKHHDNEKDLKRAEKEHEKEVKHAEKQHEKDVKQAEKDAKKDEKREHKGDLLSFLRRDKDKKYTPEEEAEFDPQEREHESHKGRDAALGGVAEGTAAYAAHEHHDGNTAGTDVNKPLPTAPGNHGIRTGAGTQNAWASDQTAPIDTRHGVDIGSTPLVEKPVGKDLGDKLHGVERNRGFQGSTGFSQGEHETGRDGRSIGDAGLAGAHSTSGQHHTGRDAALVGGAGAAGLAGEHEHRKHETASGQTSGLTGSNHYSSTTGSDIHPTTAPYDTTTSGQHHHKGRDAAALWGAGLVGEHEHRKHDPTTGPRSDITDPSYQSTSTGRQYNNTSSGLTGSHTSGQQHHTGRDAALVGGAGAAGLGAEHEYRKHDTTSGQQSGLAGSTGQYDNTSSGLAGSHTEGQGGGYQAAPGTSGLTGGALTKDNDYRKPYTTTDPQSDITSSNTGFGSSGTNTGGLMDSGTTGPTSNAGRNRLRKDPPSNHPASQAQSGIGGFDERGNFTSGGPGGAHIPASSEKREHIIGRGEEDIEKGGYWGC